MLTRCILAAVLIAAHVPIPAARAKVEGHGKPMACCAPKSCCIPGHACAMGSGCGGAGATRSGSGPWMLAGGCGDQTAQVTPVQLDPTVTAQAISPVHASFTRRAFPGFDARYSCLATRPLVPPPRA